MTNNKNNFVIYIKNCKKGTIQYNYRGLPIVELKLNPSMYIDPLYTMCISGEPESLSIGDITKGREIQQRAHEENKPIQVFIGLYTKEEVYDCFSRATEIKIPKSKSKSNREGTGTFMPTTAMAFKRWCERHNIEVLECQRMAHFDPSTINIKAEVRDYYWYEVPYNKTTALYSLKVPHVFVDPKGLTHTTDTDIDAVRIIVLTKAGGQYKSKKRSLLEKAMERARFLKTKEACELLLQVFMEKPVRLKDTFDENIDWYRDDICIQLMKEAITDEDTGIPDEIPDEYDF